MSPDKKPFGFRDLIDILIVNAKVILAFVLFLLVFISMFFGYYSILLIAVSVIFIVYLIVDALIKGRKNGDSE